MTRRGEERPWSSRVGFLNDEVKNWRMGYEGPSPKLVGVGNVCRPKNKLRRDKTN